MKVIDLINSFLDSETKINEDDDGTYRPKLKAFEQYLNNCKYENSFEALANLDVNGFYDSAHFFIIQSKKSDNPKDWVTTQSTLNNYHTVIVQFIKYVYGRYEVIINEQLLKKITLWDTDQQQREADLESLYEKHNLKAKSSKSIWKEEEINIMLKKFVDIFFHIKPQKNTSHIVDYSKNLLRACLSYLHMKLA